jgi:hypothetical protein
VTRFRLGITGRKPSPATPPSAPPRPAKSAPASPEPMTTAVIPTLPKPPGYQHRDPVPGRVGCLRVRSLVQRHRRVPPARLGRPWQRQTVSNNLAGRYSCLRSLGAKSAIVIAAQAKLLLARPTLQGIDTPNGTPW